MSRELADERVWQFRPVASVVTADEFISVKPFKPRDIEIYKQDDHYVIEGLYGIDIFPKHKFVLLVNGQLTTYNKFEDIPAEFDNVIEFKPDDTHDITFYYVFKHQGREFTYTHWIHHDMGPWEKALSELMRRETNGGWRYASSNKNW